MLWENLLFGLSDEGGGPILQLYTGGLFCQFSRTPKCNTVNNVCTHSFDTRNFFPYNVGICMLTVVSNINQQVSVGVSMCLQVSVGVCRCLEHLYGRVISYHLGLSHRLRQLVVSLVGVVAQVALVGRAISWSCRIGCVCWLCHQLSVGVVAQAALVGRVISYQLGLSHRLRQLVVSSVISWGCRIGCVIWSCHQLSVGVVAQAVLVGRVISYHLVLSHRLRQLVVSSVISWCCLIDFVSWSWHQLGLSHRQGQPEPYILWYIRCTYGISSREVAIHTVKYGADIRFWPTLLIG